MSVLPTLKKKKSCFSPKLHKDIQAMEVLGSDSDWRSPLFRQKVVAQIEEAMRKAGTVNTTQKSGTDMENHVYIKAKTREEYLSLVARLIIHFRDIYKKSLGAPDPMNALTNLTGVGGGPGTIGMEVPGLNNDWRSQVFRQKVVVQIEEAMKKAGTVNRTYKSATDMENHVYMKAKTREEYLSLVARLIIHFRDIHKKALRGTAEGPGQMSVMQMVQQVQTMQLEQHKALNQQLKSHNED